MGKDSCAEDQCLIIIEKTASMKIDLHKNVLQEIICLLVSLLLILLLPGYTKGQQSDTTRKGLEYISHYLLYRNHDTSYIKSYSEKVSVKLVSMNKYNYFKLRDRINNTSIKYTPVRDVSLGLGVAYKWFALDITFSLGLDNRSEFENTRSFDFQGSMFSSKQYVTFTIQYYQAYQLNRIKGVDVPIAEDVERREDVRTINFGFQYMYALNYTKFSIKAPFVQNEGQRKSAGSPIIGASFNMFVMNADSSIVPTEVTDYFQPDLQLIDLNILSVSASFGYMYSLVYKKRFFLTLSLIPGLNINAGDYYTENRNYNSPSINLKLNSLNAIGYNSSRFFTGFQFLADAYFSHLQQKLSAEIGHGKFAFFVGYRFGK
jgi:hypothetical protein